MLKQAVLTLQLHRSSSLEPVSDYLSKSYAIISQSNDTTNTSLDNKLNGSSAKKLKRKWVSL